MDFFFSFENNKHLNHVDYITKVGELEWII